MPTRSRPRRPAMYNTPAIRNGGFGALQVEAVTNRPLSIARRHLAASQLRMRDVEPDELSSSEWVRFLVMEETERDRWITQFVRQRRNSDESTSSAEADRETRTSKSEQAAMEATRRPEQAEAPSTARPVPTAQTPAVSLWARQLDGEFAESDNAPDSSRPRRLHARREVMSAYFDAPPPTYESTVRARTPPPAYEPRSDDDGPMSPRQNRRLA